MRKVTNRECSDIELLAAVISSSSSVASGTSAAACLIDRFGSLRALLHADNAELLACHGIGRARLGALRALPELARRYFDESLPCGQTIRSPADTESFLKARIQLSKIKMACLDSIDRAIFSMVLMLKECLKKFARLFLALGAFLETR